MRSNKYMIKLPRNYGKYCFLSMIILQCANIISNVVLYIISHDMFYPNICQLLSCAIIVSFIPLAIPCAINYYER